MPFQMIVQHAFTERLADGGFRIRNAADLIDDPAQVAALSGNPHVVRIWVDEPDPEPKAPAVAKSSGPPPSPAPAAEPAKQ